MESNTNEIKKDYHGHPNYFRIYIALVVILIVSVVLGELLSKELAVFTIFTLAAVKALMVLGQFMHLKWEPKFVWGIAVAGLVWASIFYVLVYPDIVPITLKLAQ